MQASRWCHNPESKSACPEILFTHASFISCGSCEKICEYNGHIFDSGQHIFLRENCTKCGKCVSRCPVKALEICGKEVTADEVLDEALRDKAFYEQSGGGITLSGGEPLMQYDFSLEILKKAKKAGVRTAIETSFYPLRSK